MGEQQYIPLREFVDKLDERYGHCGQHGQLFTRKTNRFVVTESLRPQIKGQRNSVPAPSFVWWLKTGEIPERAVKVKDGNRRNLRFDSLELLRSDSRSVKLFGLLGVTAAKKNEKSGSKLSLSHQPLDGSNSSKH